MIGFYLHTRMNYLVLGKNNRDACSLAVKRRDSRVWVGSRCKPQAKDELLPGCLVVDVHMSEHGIKIMCEKEKGGVDGWR